MTISMGHNGYLKYIAESSYGGGLPSSGTLQIPSDSIISAEIVPTANNELHYNIDDFDAADTSYHSREYVLNLSYKLQQCRSTGSHAFAVSLENYALARTLGDLASLAFLMKTNTSSYALLKGCKCNSISLELTLNSAIIVTEEWWGNSLINHAAAATHTNYGSLTASQAIGEAFEIYGGSTITKSGRWANGIKSATLTFGNALERVPKVGSQDMTFIAPGNLDIGLTADILSAAGGSVEITDLLLTEETAIVINTGTTASKSQKFTLNAPSYTSTPLMYSADLTHFVISADIKAQTLTHAAYT